MITASIKVELEPKFHFVQFLAMSQGLLIQGELTEEQIEVIENMIDTFVGENQRLVDSIHNDER